VFIKKRPGFKPTGFTANLNKQQLSISSTSSKTKTKPQKVSNKKPTPVFHQDESPYTFEDPQNYSPHSHEFSNESEFEGKIDNSGSGKTRRAAKMAKKVQKKAKQTVEKQKKVADPDPLHILKKVSSKKV